MKEQSNKPKSQKRLPNGDGRDFFITFRVTEQQKADFKANADACNMSVGNYVFALCYGYQPKAVMSTEQEKLLEPILGVRTDMKNFANGIAKLSPRDKDIVFGNPQAMLNWKKKLDAERALLTDIYNYYSQPNIIDFHPKHKPLLPIINNAEQTTTP